MEGRRLIADMDAVVCTKQYIIGLLLPTEGEIRFGPQLVSSAEGSRWSAVRKRQGAQVGVCPEHDVFFDKLSVREHLYLFATFKGSIVVASTHVCYGWCLELV